MDTIRIESFNTPLKGRKIWIMGDESLIVNRLHVLEQELLGRGRKLLIVSDGRKQLPKWSTKVEWDCIFRIKDASDLRLSLTYIANAGKPLRIVWIGEEPISLLPKLCLPDCTLLSYGVVQPKGEWDLLFFPSFFEATKIEEALISRMGSAKLGVSNLKSVVPELRAVRAGLVWSLIKEEKGGAIYWYDIAEGESPPEPLAISEVSFLLHDLADRICSAK